MAIQKPTNVQTPPASKPTAVVPATEAQTSWQNRTYAAGIIIGAVLGFLSAYMFNRAAEENDEKKPQAIPTTTLIGLMISAISLMRQIAESGKQRKK